MQVPLHKSLFNMRVLVTRASPQAEELSKKLRELGAAPVQFAAFEIVPPDNNDQLDRAIQDLRHYDWLIFTSAHGVRFFLERMTALRLQVAMLEHVKVAAIGPSTAAALERVGKKADYVPSEYLSEGIVAGLGDLDGKRVLLPRADIASKKLPRLLRSRGASVDEVIAYRTIVSRASTPGQLKRIFEQRIDIATFTSPSTIQNLARMVGSDILSGLLKNVKVACIGPVTADAARDLGIRVDVVANNHTVDGLIEAVVNEIGAA